MSRTKSKKYDGVYLNYLQNNDVSYSILFKDTNNKTQRLTIGKKSQGITEQYCNLKRMETINQITLGEQPLAIKKRSTKNIIKLDDVAFKYFEKIKKRSSEKNLKDRMGRYNKYFATLKNKDILSIYKNDLVKIQNNMEQLKYSPKSINQAIELFGTIYNYGLKENIYDQPNPTALIEKHNVDNARSRYLTKEEINCLYERLASNELLTLFVNFALLTGARLQGVLSIQKKDIDLTHGMVNLNDFKTKSTYKAFLTEGLVAILKEKLAIMKQNDYIFTEKRKRITDRQIQSRLKPILDEMFNEELDAKDSKNRVVIHTLRHTFASHLAISNTPIYTIQKLMNHRDINMTLRYAKLSSESGKEFVCNLYK